MKYHIQQIQNRFSKGEKMKFLFFWGHTPNHGQTIGPFIFSQWYPSRFLVNGLEYKTAEHWMMAEKARLFDDKESEEKIMNANSPAQAKELGRRVKNFDEKLWIENRYEIVKTGSYYKFRDQPDLKEFLLSTRDRVLVESSPVDRIWGIGMAKDEHNVENPLKWKGKNLLGFALMEVRDMLKN